MVALKWRAARSKLRMVRLFVPEVLLRKIFRPSSFFAVRKHSPMQDTFNPMEFMCFFFTTPLLIMVNLYQK